MSTIPLCKVAQVAKDGRLMKTILTAQSPYSDDLHAGEFLYRSLYNYFGFDTASYIEISGYTERGPLTPVMSFVTPRYYLIVTDDLDEDFPNDSTLTIQHTLSTTDIKIWREDNASDEKA